MIRYSRDQLLRPAKHLTLGPIRTTRHNCHGCNKNIHSGNEFGLCQECVRRDPHATNELKLRRRQTGGYGYSTAPFNPERPTCVECVNYLRHRCGFGFPESDSNRLFAGECPLFNLKQSAIPLGESQP